MAEDPLQQSMIQLGGDLRDELRALTELQDRRAEEREAGRQKLIDELLNKQVDDVGSQQRYRDWLKKFVWAPLVLALTGGGAGYGSHVYTRPPAATVSDVGDAVEISRAELVERVDSLEHKLATQHLINARMAEMMLDQTIHVSDAVFFLSGKMDKMSPRVRRMEKPNSVTDARNISWKAKKTRTPFSGYDPLDPLGDLLKESKYGAKKN